MTGRVSASRLSLTGQLGDSCLRLSGASRTAVCSRLLPSIVDHELTPRGGLRGNCLKGGENEPRGAGRGASDRGEA